MADPESALWKPPPSSQQEKDVVAAIRSVPLFAELRDSELRRIASRLHHRIYKNDEVIFREGDRGVGMFIILRGSVRILARLQDGTPDELARLGEKHFFGEMALLEDAPRSATSIAVGETELLGFFEPDLEAIIERNAALGSKILWNLARLMAVRLRSMNASMKAQRQQDKAGRPLQGMAG